MPAANLDSRQTMFFGNNKPMTKVAHSLYDVLNVSPRAEPVVIEAAYRALMKRYHPDQAGPGEASAANAAEINEAYAVLRSPERRAEYDRREQAAQKQAQQQARRVAIQPAPAPPRPRGSRIFAWSGWAVALIVCGAFAGLATRPGGITASVSRADAARVADRTPIDSRTQPTEKPAPIPEPVELASEGLGLSGPLPPAPRVEPVRLRLRPEAAADAPETRAKLSQRAKGARKRSPERRPKNEDPDFLEREGYIY